MLKKLGLSIFASVFATTVVLAAGAFNGYPIVGDTSGTTTCLSFGNNGVCNQYSPAGPSDVPLGATIPADTGSVNQPFTVQIPAVLTGSTIFNSSPLTGVTVAVPAGTAKVVLTPAGTIAALTLTLPAATALLDGQELFFYSNQTVTSLTLTAGTGTTLTPSITTLTAAAPVKLIYVQTSATAGVWQLF